MPPQQREQPLRRERGLGLVEHVEAVRRRSDAARASRKPSPCERSCSEDAAVGIAATPLPSMSSIVVATLKNVSARRKKLVARPARAAHEQQRVRRAAATLAARLGRRSCRRAALGRRSPPRPRCPSSSVDLPAPVLADQERHRPALSGSSSSAATRRDRPRPPGARSRTRTKRMSGSGEEVRADRREALEVVDVVLELGDDERRRVGERGAQALDVRGVAGGQRARAARVAPR